MKYQILRDYYLVWIDDLWESKKTKSGIISTNTATNNTNIELEDRGERKRRYGSVVEIPASFSDTVIDLIEPGAPQPRKFIGHEWLQSMRVAGQRGYREHEHPETKYYPSTFEMYETVTMMDIGKKMDVQIGELVYFDPKATDMERYMGPYKGGHLFSVQVNEIQCSVRDVQIFSGHKFKQKRICAQGDWVFVKLDMEDWKSITIPLPDGRELYTKVAPENLPLQGTVVSSRLDIEGQTVFFMQDADSPITVEGKELTCMREDELLATLKK